MKKGLYMEIYGDVVPTIWMRPNVLSHAISSRGQ